METRAKRKALKSTAEKQSKRDKMESPNQSNLNIEPKVYPWFSVMSLMLEQLGSEKPDLTSDISNEELFLTPDQRITNEGRNRKVILFKRTRMNYYVKNRKDSKIYFVKRDTDLSYIAKEWFINKKLEEKSYRRLIIAKFRFHSKDENGDESAFLVFDFFPCCTLTELKQNRELDIKIAHIPVLSDKKLLQGLAMIRNIYDMSPCPLPFVHNDLTSNQILYGLQDQDWYLCDFANSQISFWSSMTEEGYTWTTITSFPGEPIGNRTPLEELFDLINMFLNGIYDDELDDKVRNLQLYPEQFTEKLNKNH